MGRRKRSEGGLGEDGEELLAARGIDSVRVGSVKEMGKRGGGGEGGVLAVGSRRDRTHLRWFVRSTAVELMTCSGLALEQVQGRYYGRKKDILNSATFGVFDDLLFLQYFIRVRRTD